MRTSPTAEPFSSGAVIGGRYVRGQEIGAGAMGRLFRATRYPDGRPVVIKTPPTRGLAGRAWIRQEARALATLEHPHVVGLIEHLDGPDVACIVMESVNGDDLEVRIRRGGYTRAGAVVWLYQMAAALDHVHARGLVHRDFKPANVVIEPSGVGSRAVLIDFGLATRRSDVRARRATSVLGTPHYMAPEQALGLEADIGPPADRYALAAVALELLTGERPYRSLPLGRLLVALLEESPRRPSELGFGGPELDQVFVRAMARDPSRRPESARALIDEIVAALPTSRSSMVPRRDLQAAPTVRAKAA